MNVSLFQNIISLISAALGACAATAVGVSHRQLCALISFAAGSLFATTFFHILPESLGSLPLLAAVTALVSGYLLFYLISRYLFHVCPACAASHFEEQTTHDFQSTALLLFIAFGIHCMMDGIAIALGSQVAQKVDRSIFLAVTVHKFPEGLALCALLMKGGFEKIQALYMTLALEALTLVGWVVGLFLLKGMALGPWFYFLLIHVGGSFVYLALHAVLNESKEHSPRYVLFFFLIGLAVNALTGLIPD